MSVYLSHREALRRVRQAGCLVARLDGPPDLVIGIRRSGVPVAIAFARGAGAARTAFVTRCAGTRPDASGTLARWGRQLVPRRLRQLGKSLLYRRVMRLTLKLQRPPSGSAPFIEEQGELREWLTAATRRVVVVDDAIDTGITMRRLVETITSVDTRVTVMSFALTSTLGLKVHEPQHHLFEDVVEYEEGDLALVDESGAARILAGLAPPDAPATAAGLRRLDVQLYELLVRPPHECAARALVHCLRSGGRYAAAFSLPVRCALWRLGRRPDDHVMEMLHRRYRSLPEACRKAFGPALTAEFLAALQPLIRQPSMLAQLNLSVRVGYGDFLAGPAASALAGAEVVAGD